MDILLTILIFLHLLSWAVVLGAALSHLRGGKVPKGLMHAALSALITGLLIVGAVEMGDIFDLNYVKISVKLTFAAVIAVLAVMAERRSDGHRMLGAITALTVVNVGVAVFW